MRLAFLISALCALPLLADDAPPGAKALPGHSAGGEAFNEGPRQKAVLMEGTGNVHLAITAKGELAQRFFDQGVGQLHGFWYFEAERSFRQVAAIDPQCAMAYWGMAMANDNNSKRAGEFIMKAVALKDKASRREQLWIGALADFHADPKKPEALRRRALVRSLEKLSFEFPEEIEAKAFLLQQAWENAQGGIPISSHQALDTLGREVLAANPLHPAHHYRIHLWNHEDDRRALDSAARCGQSAPGIAHMWHMPGHTFTKLNRYADAAWQQEAAARVDHAQMSAARILPEQIHNYAHNNDWLIENLQYIGRAHDAIELAKNMIELPRLAPKAEPVGKRGAYSMVRNGFTMGRNRLLETAVRYELWNELVALENTFYLAPAEEPVNEVKRLCALGVAHYAKADLARGDEKHAALDAELRKVREERLTAGEQAEEKAKSEKKLPAEIAKAMADAMQPFSERSEATKAAIAELRLYRALAHGKPDEARAQLKLAKKTAPERLARIHLQLGDRPAAEKAAREAVEKNAGQVHPLATLAHTLWQIDKKPDALETFRKLRDLSAQIDLDLPAFARLAPLARELKLPADWRPALTWPKDSGERPPLTALGPFRWQPYSAPGFSLSDSTARQTSLAEFHGRPVLVIFYLGSGCARCLEQLNVFSPMTKAFADAGISLVAISTDSAESLHETFAKATTGQGFPFPILADPALETFKAYRAFDDFENIPLHGLFLIDGDGEVRWQDISFEAFRDAKWLLAESKRLLSLPSANPTATAAVKQRPD